MSVLLVGCSPPVPSVDGGDPPVVDAGTDAGVVVDAGVTCPPLHHVEDGACVQKLQWNYLRTLPLAEARDHHMTFSFATDAGVFLALAGGMSGGTMFDSVFVSQVTGDGELSTWVRSSNALPEPLAGGAVAVVGRRVYMLGGIDGAMELSLHSYSAPLNDDGTIGPWRAERELAGSARYHHSGVVLGDSILVTGGFDGQSIFSGAFLTKVAADGTLGEWATVETAGAMSHHANVVVGSRVFTVGGFNGQGAGILKVQSAGLAADGGLTAWSDTGADLPSRHRTHSVSVFNGALYLLEGETGDGFALGDAWTGTIHAPLLEDGGIGAWVDDLIENPLPRRHTHQAPAIGSGIYSCFGSNQAEVTVNSCGALMLY